jgi:hypothetical protein
MESESLRDLWEHIGGEYGRLKDISRVALYVPSIPASSAAAERHIWRQRRGLCPDRARTFLWMEENRTRIPACATFLVSRASRGNEMQRRCAADVPSLGPQLSLDRFVGRSSSLIFGFSQKLPPVGEKFSRLRGKKRPSTPKEISPGGKMYILVWKFVGMDE